ncbi:GH36-type glycosyl hydrolase domain-containing protein [Methylocystis sp. JAN1]|uniref:GH36-type glycosyl hydrolase domain-containing protein n=1 Tax=Methylocystis sp. JAN1 TaxID=3397211 RepID=UPI003FA23923
MPEISIDRMKTPRREDLGLVSIANQSGTAISFLPSGALFSIEHAQPGHGVMVNQLLGSPLAGEMGGLYLRAGGARSELLPISGARSRARFGVAEDRAVWEAEQGGMRHRATLWLHPSRDVWFWRVEATNGGGVAIPCDCLFVQDLGLGSPGFVMNNEAYASQYIDHFVLEHVKRGFIVMSRQNLSQNGAHPWIAHGCLEGAAGFATDFRQFAGPGFRDAARFDPPFGADLPSTVLQYETGCAALQTRPVVLAPGETAVWTIFAVYRSDHPHASGESDLAAADAAESAFRDWRPRMADLSTPVRNALIDAPAAVADDLDEKAIEALYPGLAHVERRDEELLSFFVPGESHSRHVVLRAKERLVARRHGAILVNADDYLPTDETLSATCWMHGVFSAQLTIGNSSFHKLFSVSRDPYNVARANGLRILVELDGGWRLLTIPSAFEMGLGDCRWIYRLGARTVTVQAIVDADAPAMRWRIAVEGAPTRFLIVGHLVMGESEFAHASHVEFDARKARFSFRPDGEWLWAKRYPDAVYRLVVGAPEDIDAAGGDELLYDDGKRRSGAYVAIRTRPTARFSFAVVGSLTDPARAEALADKALDETDAELRIRAEHCWRNLTRGLRVTGEDAAAEATNAILPWFAQNAIVHLKAPHGLEQYTGAAWGTRDVCQGPVELLLGLEHDDAVKRILRIVYGEQEEAHGDWPQWFMLEPYSSIRDAEAHGDVIVWPLKALCDYIEATGDFDFLNEQVAWRRKGTFEKTAHADAIAVHVEKQLATMRARFIPGTHLIRYGNGDWNDSLQPVSREQREWMVSSWTVALLYQQLRRYADILRLAGRAETAEDIAAATFSMRDDFNRHLIRDGIVAGYAVFDRDGGTPRLLLHPSDELTGISFSMLPMAQGISGGIFTDESARRHLDLIRERLLFADGARLMDKPLAYHGGPERIFRRAESAAFFGREIGLMYTHSHLRFAEALAALGEADAFWDALLVVNPISVTEILPNASLRQRNAYFSSSDAAFSTRYQASAEWARVKEGTIPVDGGWRIYSSGPGIYVSMAVERAFGWRRRFGKRYRSAQLLPASVAVTEPARFAKT